MISQFAARLIAQQALVGQTWAGDRVLNSPIDPLAGLVDADANWSPVIAVFSTLGSTDVVGQDISGSPGIAGLMIQIYVPPDAVITAADGSETIAIQGKGSLAAFVLDTIAYQVRNALINPAGPWADLWARFVVKVKDWKVTPPFLEVDEGLRVPAKTIEIDFEPLADPVPGRPMTPSFAALYAQMLAQASLAPLGEIMKQAIEQPGTLPDWARVIMQLGLSQAAALNTGIAPLPETITADAPAGVAPAEVATYDVEAPTSADVSVIVPEATL